MFDSSVFLVIDCVLNINSDFELNVGILVVEFLIISILVSDSFIIFISGIYVFIFFFGVLS